VYETDPDIVRAVKQRLNDVLALGAELRLDADDPQFGPETKRAVKLFQTRSVDADGRPLKQDGEIGALTWAALFGPDTVPSTDRAADAFLGKVLEIASAEEAKHVREEPKDSNRGPDVDKYLQRAGAPLGSSWCCAFVYYCFDEAARAESRANPMFKTAGCLAHWNAAGKNGAARIAARDAVANPDLIRPGAVFVIDHGGGLGHTGLVESVTGGLIGTIEGNTDASKTREGGGVYRLTRKLLEINKGYIEYRS
jgi:hypothetical protein